MAQGPKIRLGQFGRAIRREDGKIVDNDDVVSGIVLLRKGADSDNVLKGIHAKVKELNDRHPSARSENRSIHRPQRAGAIHHPHRAAQSDRRHHSGGHHSVSVPREHARGADCRPHHSLFAAVCVHLPQPAPHSRESAVAGRARFRHGGGWRGGHGREHRAPPAHASDRATASGSSVGDQIRAAAHEVQRPVFYAIAIIITAYIPDLHAAARGRAAVQAHGLDRGVRAAGRVAVFDSGVAGARELSVPPRREGMAQSGDARPDRALSQSRALGHPRTLGGGRRGGTGARRDRVSSLERDHRLRVPAAPR